MSNKVLDETEQRNISTAYKVVRELEDGTLASAIQHGGACEKKYVPGLWTHPEKGTMLFVFESLRDAQVFARFLNAATQVWVCDVIECALLRGRLPAHAGEWEAYDWWCGWRQMQEWKVKGTRVAVGHLWGNIVPLGTLLASAVRIKSLEGCYNES